MRRASSDRFFFAARRSLYASGAARSIVLCALIAGCGPSAPPPAAPTVGASNAAAEASAKDKGEGKGEPAAMPLPTACASNEGDLCLPPEDFAKRLCGGSFPDAALVLFGKGSPWSRGYLRRTMEAWSASGGSSSNEKLELDEEVLLLLYHAPAAGGMQVSGASGGNYEALRWDGSCVSLTAEEVTRRLPPEAKHSKIPWKQLDNKIREALASDEKVGPVVAEYRKECKGASFGEVSPKCEKLDKKLSDSIVNHIRAGGSIPGPSSLP